MKIKLVFFYLLLSSTLFCQNFRFHNGSSVSSPVNNQNLGNVPINTPLEFAFVPTFTKSNIYNYALGYYTLLLIDNVTNESFEFQSFAVNTNYSNTKLPDKFPLTPQNTERIRFFLRTTNSHTIQIWRDNGSPVIIFSATISGIASPHKGPLEFAAKHNSKYLKFRDGSGFFGVAENMSYEGPCCDILSPFNVDRTLYTYLGEGYTGSDPTASNDILGKFDANGGNLIQIYLEPNSFEIENFPLGNYANQEDRIRTLEKIFQWCWERDIYIQIGAMDHNIQVEWSNPIWCTSNCNGTGTNINPYREFVNNNPLEPVGKLSTNGSVNQYKFPNTEMMFFVHPSLKEFSKNKIQYLIARFSNYPNFFSLNIGTEFETIGDNDAYLFDNNINNLKLKSDNSTYNIDENPAKNGTDLYHAGFFWIPPTASGGLILHKSNEVIASDWAVEMNAYAKNIKENLITNLGGGLWRRDDIFHANPNNFSFINNHFYTTPSRNSLYADNIYLRGNSSKIFGKPFLAGETGPFGGVDNGDIGRFYFHNYLWTFSLCGSFSSGMDWNWNSLYSQIGWMFPHKNKPYRRLRPLNLFFENENMHKYNWTPMGTKYILDLDQWDLSNIECGNNIEYKMHKKILNINSDQYIKVDDEFEKLMTWTFGNGSVADGPPQPQWNLNSNILESEVNCTSTDFGTFANCRNYLPEIINFRYTGFMLPEARQLGNFGKNNQVLVKSNGNYNPDLEVFALRSRQKIFGWLHHKESNFEHHDQLSQIPASQNYIWCCVNSNAHPSNGNNIFTVSNITLDVPVEQCSGNYQVRWYSTYTDSISTLQEIPNSSSVVNATNGIITIQAPNIRVDNVQNGANEHLYPDYAFKITLNSSNNESTVSASNILSGSSLVYSPVSSPYRVWSVGTDNYMKLFSSTNGTTWSAVSLPTTTTNYKVKSGSQIYIENATTAFYRGNNNRLKYYYFLNNSWNNFEFDSYNFQNRGTGQNWNANWIDDAAAKFLFVPGIGASPSDKRVGVFYRGSNGYIQQYFWNSTLSRWEHVHLNTFAAGTSNYSPYTNYSDDFPESSTNDKMHTSSPIISFPSSKNILYKGPDNKLRYYFFNESTLTWNHTLLAGTGIFPNWTANSELSGNSFDVTIINSPTCREGIIYRGIDGNLYLMEYNAGWSLVNLTTAMNSVNTIKNNSSIITSKKVPMAFFISTNNEIISVYKKDNTWKEFRIQTADILNSNSIIYFDDFSRILYFTDFTQQIKYVKWNGVGFDGPFFLQGNNLDGFKYGNNNMIISNGIHTFIQVPEGTSNKLLSIKLDNQCNLAPLNSECGSGLTEPNISSDSRLSDSESINQIFDFDLFPNPNTSRIINLKLSNPINDYLYVELFDLSGRVLMSGNLIFQNGESKIENLGLDNGLYFVKIKYNEIQSIKKLVVAN